MILPRVSGEERVDFILKMLTIMVSQGSAGMSQEDFKEFKKNLTDVINKTKAGEDVKDKVVDINTGKG
jgi:hypothetical protein